MSVELDYKIGQLQYEISILGLDEEELTGVTKRTEELKDLVKNLAITDVVNQREQLIAYEEWRGTKLFAGTDTEDRVKWYLDGN